MRQLENFQRSDGRVHPAIARVAVLLALLGAASAIDLDWFRGWSGGKETVRQKLDPFPREFRQFFREVYQRTERGERLLIAMEAEYHHHGYLAEYETPARLVTIGDWNSGAGMAQVSEVDLIAAWPDTFPLPENYREVYRGNGGVLARRLK